MKNKEVFLLLGILTTLLFSCSEDPITVDVTSKSIILGLNSKYEELNIYNNFYENERDISYWIQYIEADENGFFCGKNFDDDWKPIRAYLNRRNIIPVIMFEPKTGCNPYLTSSFDTSKLNIAYKRFADSMKVWFKEVYIVWGPNCNDTSVNKWGINPSDYKNSFNKVYNIFKPNPKFKMVWSVKLLLENKYEPYRPFPFDVVGVSIFCDTVNDDFNKHRLFGILMENIIQYCNQNGDSLCVLETSVNSKLLKNKGKELQDNLKNTWIENVLSFSDSNYPYSYFSKFIFFSWFHYDHSKQPDYDVDYRIPDASPVYKEVIRKLPK